MKFRPSKIEEIPTLVALSVAAFDSDVLVGAEEAGGPPDYDSIAWHEEMCREGHLYTAEEAGEIVGCAIIFIQDDIMFIGRIFVGPAYFRKGYGMQIMTALEDFPGISKWVLDTPIWNIRTNRFYQKLGYSEVNRDEEMVYYEKHRA